MRVLDAHIHLNDDAKPIAEMYAAKHAAYRDAGLDDICLVCDTSAGREYVHKNFISLLWKLVFPQDTTRVFTSLQYHLPDVKIEKDTFRSQAERCVEYGADGFKMYEGKPTARRLIGNRSLLDESYRSFFAYLEEKRLPLALHMADPPHFWSARDCGAEAFERGWYCGDSTFTPYERIVFEVKEVLARYPGMPVIIPQLGYLCDDFDQAEKMLEKYDNLMFDLGPTGEFYALAENDPGAVKQFIQRWHSRLIFAAVGVERNLAAVNDKAGRLITVLSELGAGEDIFSGNFEKLCGAPAKTDKAALLDMADKLETILAPCKEGDSGLGFAKKRTREAKEFLQTL